MSSPVETAPAVSDRPPSPPAAVMSPSSGASALQEPPDSIPPLDSSSGGFRTTEPHSSSTAYGRSPSEASIPALELCSKEGRSLGVAGSQSAGSVEDTDEATAKRQRGNFSKVKTFLALVLWLGLFHLNFFALCLIALSWPHPLAVAALALFVALVFIPINKDSAFGKKVATFVARNGIPYFPIKVVFEDRASLDPSRAYVIAYEPHSILPIGIMAFCPPSGLFPLTRLHVLGSSALDMVPICRHIWTWLGMEAVSRASFSRLLSNGVSCVLVPGGLHESLLIEKEREVLYLKHSAGDRSWSSHHTSVWFWSETDLQLVLPQNAALQTAGAPSPVRPYDLLGSLG